MRAYRMDRLTGLDGLVAVNETTLTPGLGEVLVRVKATSINPRDLVIASGLYPMNFERGRIPFSDGAGVIEQVGEGVNRFAVGDRVVASYLPTWFGGPLRSLGEQYGTERDGWLADYKVVHEEALVTIPEHLSFEEAATLPSSAVTAWSAVKGVGAGDTLLVQGSGGISLFALQFARAMGARVIATTSTEEKAARLRERGAEAVVNYRTNPEWGLAVRELTDGRGVDWIVEVGGAGTIRQSMKAITYRGQIALVGMLAPSSAGMDLLAFFLTGATLRTIGLGSRSDFEEMNRVIVAHRIRPIIDRVFAFEELPDAWRHFEAGTRFGKVVITHYPVTQ
jgi:NADPH:quinone reductase-like Zn-dependent oxidoreductase